MIVGETQQISKRYYDNPLDGNGKPKDNEVLGLFRILQCIEEDMYSGKWLAEKDGKTFLIIETEVSGINGGSIVDIKELNL